MIKHHIKSECFLAYKVCTMMFSTFGIECTILECTVSFKLYRNKTKPMFHFAIPVCVSPEEKKIAGGCGNGLDSLFWSS